MSENVDKSESEPRKPGPAKGQLKGIPKNYYTDETKAAAVKDFLETEQRTVDFESIAAKYNCSVLSLRAWAQKSNKWTPKPKQTKKQHDYSKDLEVMSPIEAAIHTKQPVEAVTQTEEPLWESSALAKVAQEMKQYDPVFDAIKALRISIAHQQKELAEKESFYRAKQNELKTKYNAVL